MKKNISLAIILSILICSLSTIPVYAQECDHEYTNDVCEKCGEYTLHHFEETICFYTIKNDVPIWERPTKYSNLIETIEDVLSLIHI